MNGRWVKSHKIVRFPRTNFNPTKYVAPRAPRKMEEQTPPSSHPLDEGGGEGSKIEAEEKESQVACLSNGQSHASTDVKEIGKCVSEMFSVVCLFFSRSSHSADCVLWA